MKRIALIKLLTDDQDKALGFYRDKLGFTVAEDANMGDYRWLLVGLPDNAGFCINLELATTDEQRALIGRQAADLPLLSIETDNCLALYEELLAKGVEFEGEPVVHPYGTGVMMHDLYGNKIYINQD